MLLIKKQCIYFSVTHPVQAHNILASIMLLNMTLVLLKATVSFKYCWTTAFHLNLERKLIFLLSVYSTYLSFFPFIKDKIRQTYWAVFMNTFEEYYMNLDSIHFVHYSIEPWGTQGTVIIQGYRSIIWN